MLQPTDFMLTCPHVVTTLTNGLQDPARRALKDAASVVLPLAVVTGITIGISQRVFVGLVVWLAILGLAGWWIRRRPVGLDADAVVESLRGWDAAGGRYAPPQPSGTLPTELMLQLDALSAFPLLPVFAFVRARRLLDQQASRVCGTSGWTRPSLDGRCEQALHLYTCYPDRTFAAPSGFGGVWFPEGTLEERRVSLARLMFRHRATALAGLALGLMLAMAAFFLPVWAAFPVFLYFMAGSATSVAMLALSNQMLHAALIEPLVRLVGEQQALLPNATNEWEDCVQRVASSTYEVDGVGLAEHVFMGWILPPHTEAAHPFRRRGAGVMPTPMPLLVHRSVLSANCHLTGATQSGKSITAEAGMLLQLIRPHQVPQRDDRGGRCVGLDGQPLWCSSDPTPVLVLDLKGDQALFNTLREDCARLGRKFQAFTLDHGYASAHFAPLEDLGVAAASPIERTELLIDGLSMYYGAEYGKAFFSKQNRDLLLLVQRSGKAPPTSFEQLYKLLLDEIEPARHRDVLELLSSVFALAQYPVLAPAPPGVDQIRFPEVIRECSVAYFRLPARSSTMSIRDTAKLALLSFMAAAANWNDRYGPRHSVCVIDEAQIVVSKTLATMFQQCAGGANMSLVLINQSPTDLDSTDAPRLSDTVRANTRYKQAFTILDPDEAKVWMEWSGEAVSVLRGTSVTETVSNSPSGSTTATAVGSSEHEVLHKQLNQNVINQVNNTMGCSLVHIATSAGFTQLGGVPCRVWSPWIMSKGDYDRRRFTPWPTAPQPMSPVTGSPVTAVNTKTHESVTVVVDRNYAALEALFKRLSDDSGDTKPA